MKLIWRKGSCVFIISLFLIFQGAVQNTFWFWFEFLYVCNILYVCMFFIVYVPDWWENLFQNILSISNIHVTDSIGTTQTYSEAHASAPFLSVGWAPGLGLPSAALSCFYRELKTSTKGSTGNISSPETQPAHVATSASGAGPELCRNRNPVQDGNVDCSLTHPQLLAIWVHRIQRDVDSKARLRGRAVESSQFVCLQRVRSRDSASGFQSVTADWTGKGLSGETTNRLWWRTGQRNRTQCRNL